MNEILEKFAREYLKENLTKCTDGERNLFTRMYSYSEPDASINRVVDNMPVEKLDWAMMQVKRTLDKRNEI